MKSALLHLRSLRQSTDNVERPTRSRVILYVLDKCLSLDNLLDLLQLQLLRDIMYTILAHCIPIIISNSQEASKVNTLPFY